MKVFADLSMLLKLAIVCLIVGFVLGLCATGTRWLPTQPSPAPRVPVPTGSAK